MEMLADWKRIVRKAWSIRLIILASLLTGCEAIISSVGIEWLSVPQWARLVIIMLVMSGAFFSRLIVQRKMHDDEK